MTINEYQEAALKTCNTSLNKKDLLLNGVMGLCGESGEVIDLVKKHIAQGHELNRDKMIEELGDVAWYIALTAYALDVDMDSVLKQNIDKLKKRYPHGFEKQRSINREQ